MDNIILYYFPTTSKEGPHIIKSTGVDIKLQMKVILSFRDG